MMRWLLLAAMAAGVAACGGSGDVSGSLPGIDLSNIADSVAVHFVDDSTCDNSTTESGYYIVMSSNSGLCTALQNGTLQAGSYLILEVGNSGTNTHGDPGTGTYSIQLTNPAALGFAVGYTSTTTCGKGYISGTPGSITLSSVAGGTVTGSYNMPMADLSSANSTGAISGTISGSFTAAPCTLSHAQRCTSSTGGPSCN